MCWLAVYAASVRHELKVKDSTIAALNTVLAEHRAQEVHRARTSDLESKRQRTHALSRSQRTHALSRRLRSLHRAKPYHMNTEV